MKTLLRTAAITVVFGLALASMSAQTQSTASSSTTYIETSKFIGKKVKSAQGEEIGTVKDVVLDRNTGCLAYTVVSTAGAGGTRATGGGKMVAVPWAVYSPSSDVNVFTVTVDRDRIYNAPVFDYARIDEYSRPDYITNVYSYYGVSAGAGAGVGVSGSTTTGATTTGAPTTATAAGATTGAATSPAGGAGVSASPGASESPGATASRGTKASPSPHSTPARSPHGTPTGRPHASPRQGRETASPAARGGASGTPETRQRGRRGMTGSLPESQRSPSEQGSPHGTGAGSRESRSGTGQAHPEGATQGQTETGTRHRAKTGKRETSSPPEQPEQQ